ncbi:DNA-binding YbaB/EbfC family protein [Bradyrhizobium sp. LM6.11]
MVDIFGMMKQAQQLQSKMQEMQDQLANVEVEGISGGGLVAVRMTAKMDVKGVRIDPSLMKVEEREVLEDLLVTAFGDAPPQGGGRHAGEDAGAHGRAQPAAGDARPIVWALLRVLKSSGWSSFSRGCRASVRARRGVRRCI